MPLQQPSTVLASRDASFSLQLIQLRKFRRIQQIKLTLKELKTEPATGKILKYKNNWIQHVNKMQRERERIPKLLKNHKPRGR
jgi:uncharacterized C2H2 Zn-finger protein